MDLFKPCIIQILQVLPCFYVVFQCKHGMEQRHTLPGKASCPRIRRPYLGFDQKMVVISQHDRII